MLSFILCNVVIFVGIVAISLMALRVSNKYSLSRLTFSVVLMHSSFRRFSVSRFSTFPFCGRSLSSYISAIGHIVFSPRVSYLLSFIQNVIYSSLTYRERGLSRGHSCYSNCRGVMLQKEKRGMGGR